jgi:NADPH-dependent 2,4-dienoyl-CoA reductase/sulfur reductase-like enzyme
MTVVIVGGSLAGVRTAQALRMRGFTEPITVVSAEAWPPYDRPPLSKEFLTADAPVEPSLLNPDELTDLRLRVIAPRTAVGVDPGAHEVLLDGGARLSYSTLVIATGSSPRFPPGLSTSIGGVHALRTLADARAIRAAMARRPSVAVVGGGFIGGEVAAAARGLGLAVTIVERADVPFAQGVGPEAGELVSRMHRVHGVIIRAGVEVVGVDVFGVGAGASHQVRGLTLSDGTHVPADLVVVGIGVVPNTGWLEDSTVALADGVLCDAELRSVSTEDVFAGGDVARWQHPLLGRPVRIEHWTNANEHADVIASALVGKPVQARSVPYVWSDQYDQRIQIVGRPEPDHQPTPLPGAHAGLLYGIEGHLTAAMVVGNPRLAMKLRRAVAVGADLAEAEDLARGMAPRSEAT